MQITKKRFSRSKCRLELVEAPFGRPMLPTAALVTDRDHHFLLILLTGAAVPLTKEGRVSRISSRLDRNCSATLRASRLLRISRGLMNMMISVRCFWPDLVPKRSPTTGTSFSTGIPDFVSGPDR